MFLKRMLKVVQSNVIIIRIFIELECCNKIKRIIHEDVEN